MPILRPLARRTRRTPRALALVAVAALAGSCPALQLAPATHVVTAGPISECYTVATNPPVGAYDPSVTVCRPL